MDDRNAMQPPVHYSQLDRTHRPPDPRRGALRGTLIARLQRAPRRLRNSPRRAAPRETAASSCSARSAAAPPDLTPAANNSRRMVAAQPAASVVWSRPGSSLAAASGWWRRPAGLSAARARESDPGSRPVAAERAQAARLAEIEDHEVTNQFSAMGYVKPGLFRALDAAPDPAGPSITPRATSTRAAAGARPDDSFRPVGIYRRRQAPLFASNYDGSLDSYMDDFINKVAWGMNVVFGNGVGYPTTRWLLLDGAKDEQTFKHFLRRHELPDRCLVQRPPGFTAFDLHRNSVLRQGLEASAMTEGERASGRRFCDGGTVTAEYSDIQGLLRFGFGKMPESRYFLLRVRDAAAARAWLTAAPVTTAETQSPPPDRILQVAFTASGLRALGVPEPVVQAFSPEFISGIAGESARSRRLGDLDDNAPSEWQWGRPGESIDLLVALFAAHGRMEAWQQEVCRAPWSTAFDARPPFTTSDLGGREPFGFVDGISQPELDWQGTRDASQDQLDYSDQVALGEFLLGYSNEYCRYTDRPLLDAGAPGAAGLAPAEDDSGRRDLGRNGSYLVMRQLEQDVRGFWRFVYSAAAPKRIARASPRPWSAVDSPMATRSSPAIRPTTLPTIATPMASAARSDRTSVARIRATPICPDVPPLPYLAVGPNSVEASPASGKICSRLPGSTAFCAAAANTVRRCRPKRPRAPRPPVSRRAGFTFSA